VNPIYQFQDAIAQAGLTPPNDIIADGNIHRFSSNGKPSNRNGWYVFHADEPSVGIYGDWSKDFQSKWSADIGRPYTTEEIKAYRLKMDFAKSLVEKDQAEKQSQAQEEVAQLWASAEPVKFHPYLDKKWVKAHNIRQLGEELLIPMYENKELKSLQHIQADGFKKFHAGGKTKGTYFTIGGKPSEEGLLCICEGYATGASIYEATGYPVVVTFTANNLLLVAQSMRKKFPKAKMVICADDDHKTEGNIGIKKATETALVINGLLAIPIFGEGRLDHQTDFNDMALVSGMEAVKQAIYKAMPPRQSKSSKEDWGAPIPLPKGLPVKPFDYELLPESLRAWVHDISNRMQCPPDFPAVASIVSASSLIGARAVIRPKEKDSWEVTPNLWGCVVGRAGVMKTPAVKEVLNPLWKLDAKERQNHELLIADWEHEKYITELLAKDNANKAKGLASKGDMTQAKRLIGDAQIPSKPVGKRHIVNDSTVESLQELMAENSWGFLCFRDELYGLFKSMEKQGQEGARSFYLSAYDGNQPFTVDRISRGSIHIPRTCLSLFGTIQPSRLEEYIRGAMQGGMGDDGLLQRFGLMVFPHAEGEFKYVDEQPNVDAKEIAWGVFERLAELETNGDEPKVWRFSKEAQALFLDWYVPFNNELKSGDLHPAMESHLSKYRKLIPALALVFAHIDTPYSNQVVEVTELARALDWCEYLRSHAERIYQSATIPETTGARAILKRIKSKALVDRFTPREIAQKNWTALNDVEAVRRALALLVEYDYLRMERLAPSSVGGRISERYFINPNIGDENE
jgi:putative DNA primase/helicase